MFGKTMHSNAQHGTAVAQQKVYAPSITTSARYMRGKYLAETYKEHHLDFFLSRRLPAIWSIQGRHAMFAVLRRGVTLPPIIKIVKTLFLIESSYMCLDLINHATGKLLDSPKFLKSQYKAEVGSQTSWLGTRMQMQRLSCLGTASGDALSRSPQQNSSLHTMHSDFFQ